MVDSEEKDALGWLDFPGQFIASKEDRTAPYGWCKNQLLGWQLQYSPDVSLRHLVNAVGDPVGWLMGLPTQGEQFIEDELTIEDPRDLYELGGPWVAIDLDREEVYVDSFGHLSVVFREDGQVVATNPAFIPEAAWNESLSSLMNIPEEDKWYPFGLTPRRGVLRLMPNHYLDMKTGNAHRHWPDAELLKSGMKPIELDRATEIVSRVIKQNIRAMAQKYPLKMALTAGYDSRVLLACAREFADRLECITHYLHPATRRLDLVTATHIARRHGLRLTVLKERPSTVRQKEAWLQRTGRAAAGANYHHVGTFSQDGNVVPTLTGHGAELLKGAYHTSSSDPPEDLSAAEITKRLRLPCNDEVASAAEQWVNNIPTGDTKLMLDLLYPEQRGACWAGVLRHGTPGALGLWPFAHRDVLEVAVRLPVHLKRSKAVHRSIIEQEWSELLEVSVNEWWGWRRVAMKPRRWVVRSRMLAGRLSRRLLGER